MNFICIKHVWFVSGYFTSIAEIKMAKKCQFNSKAMNLAAVRINSFAASLIGSMGAFNFRH
jgi:hypothetical protein